MKVKFSYSIYLINLNVLARLSMTLDNRSKYLRSLIIRMIKVGKRGLIGSAMSLVEILRILYVDTII